jgi:hypothetical protein
MRTTTRPRAALAATVLVLVLAGCGAPHPGLSNGSVSACYRAIPTARDAVHNTHATLIGVHRVAADLVKSRLPASAQAVLAGENDTTVCTVAFQGAFTPGEVDLAPATEQGKYAVVLVTSRHLHLLASVVLNQLPKSLGKRTI